MKLTKIVALLLLTSQLTYSADNETKNITIHADASFIKFMEEVKAKPAHKPSRTIATITIIETEEVDNNAVTFTNASNYPMEIQSEYIQKIEQRAGYNLRHYCTSSIKLKPNETKSTKFTVEGQSQKFAAFVKLKQIYGKNAWSHFPIGITEPGSYKIFDVAINENEKVELKWKKLPTPQEVDLFQYIRDNADALGQTPEMKKIVDLAQAADWL